MSNIKVLVAPLVIALSIGLCAAQKGHKFTGAQAAKVALAKYHGKLAKKPVLEKEDGMWQYEIIVQMGKVTKEVNVGADSGKINSVETVTAAEEAREAKAEKGKSKGKAKGKDNEKEKGD